MSKLLFEVRAEVCDSLYVLLLGLLAKILAHLVGVKLRNNVGAVVHNIVSVVSLLWISRIVAVLLSKESKDCA